MNTCNQFKKPVSLGIDLGSSKICSGVWKYNHRVEIIPNEFGELYTPAYISFTKEGEIIFGEQAKKQLLVNPENTIFDFKYLLGRKFCEIEDKIKKNYWPFKMIKNKEDGLIKIVINCPSETAYDPDELLAILLKKIKRNCEDYLMNEVEDIIITVPATFYDAQRQAVRDSCVRAGFHVLRIINESTAAIIGAGLDKVADETKILVIDIGKILKATIVNVEEGICEVIDSNAYEDLGSTAFEEGMMAYCLDFIFKETGLSLQKSKKEELKFRYACEKGVIELMDPDKSEYSINTNDMRLNDLLIPVSIKITREKFISFCMNIFANHIYAINQGLKNAKINQHDLKHIIFIGALTELQEYRNMISNYFDDLINIRYLNPKEIVTYGAAIQSAIIFKVDDLKLSSLMFFEVTNLTLGVEVNGKFMCPCVNKFTSYPTGNTFPKIFTTCYNNQTSVRIRIFQGESILTKYNFMLCEIELTGIPPLPSGVPEIIISFYMNDSRSFLVRVEEKISGVSAEFPININAGLTRDIIENHKKDCQINLELYKKEKELMDSNEIGEENYLDIKEMYPYEENRTKLNQVVEETDSSKSNNNIAAYMDELD